VRARAECGRDVAVGPDDIEVVGRNHPFAGEARCRAARADKARILALKRELKTLLYGSVRVEKAKPPGTGRMTRELASRVQMMTCGRCDGPLLVVPVSPYDWAISFCPKCSLETHAEAAQ